MTTITCPICQRSFSVHISDIKRGAGKFCSTSCYHLGRTRPLHVRFWEKVNKTDTCWIWTGGRKRKPWDYGVIGLKRGHAILSAHRVSWELHHGQIPHGICVLHHCDNPPCVNPAHLFLGSLQNNTHDMLRTHRHKVMLTDAQEQDIREQYTSGCLSQTMLAKTFGVGQSTISRILLKKRTVDTMSR